MGPGCSQPSTAQARVDTSIPPSTSMGDHPRGMSRGCLSGTVYLGTRRYPRKAGALWQLEGGRGPPGGAAGLT